MRHCLAVVSYCILLVVHSHAIHIEPGFPFLCGVPDVVREQKPDVVRMKVRSTPKSWPWVAGLMAERIGLYPYCTGTLISPSLILTAAHCVRDYFGCTPLPLGVLTNLTIVGSDRLMVFLGTHDYTRGAGSERPYLVRHAIVHPHFNPLSDQDGNDIAILKLFGPITQNSAVKPLCFPSLRTTVMNGQICYYAGWGKLYKPWSRGQLVFPKTMREAAVQMEKDEICMQMYKSYKTHLHACIRTPGTSPCHGDSGGGIFCPSIDGTWFWNGLINSGQAGCMGLAAKITRMTAVHDWIKSTAFAIGL